MSGGLTRDRFGEKWMHEGCDELHVTAMDAYRCRAERAEAKLAEANTERDEDARVMNALRRQRDEAEAKLTKVRELHYHDPGAGLCMCDGETWPCETRRIVDGEDA